MVSLGDGAGGALVDAGTAVDAFAGVDDSDVLAGDGTLRADVNACTACDTLGSVHCNHYDYLGKENPRGTIKRCLDCVQVGLKNGPECSAPLMSDGRVPATSGYAIGDRMSAYGGPPSV